MCSQRCEREERKYVYSTHLPNGLLLKSPAKGFSIGSGSPTLWFQNMKLFSLTTQMFLGPAWHGWGRTLYLIYEQIYKGRQFFKTTTIGFLPSLPKYPTRKCLFLVDIKPRKWLTYLNNRHLCTWKFKHNSLLPEACYPWLKRLTVYLSISLTCFLVNIQKVNQTNKYLQTH